MALFIGIDLGTSGCRVIAIDENKQLIASASHAIPPAIESGDGHFEQSAQLWWQALLAALEQLLQSINAEEVKAIAVDGTSATLLLCDHRGLPLSSALMYNDTRCRNEASIIDQHAAHNSAAHGAGSSLAKLLNLSRQYPDAAHALHQADWIMGKLCGHFGHSDENNCLKLGFDPQLGKWPAWLEKLDINQDLLPHVHTPGDAVAIIDKQLALMTGLPEHTQIIAGTTDSIAAFIATGAHELGEAVTSLGSTLVLKLISDKPVFSKQHGIYSHKLFGQWLLGGASNSGGASLLRFFSLAEIQEMTPALKPQHPTGFDYYPLPANGERFPIADPAFKPRIPQHMPDNPAERLLHFQGLLEGISRIEKKGYQLLHELGAPWPSKVISVGGGACNQAWRQIRQNDLQVPVVASAQQDAAYGSALLALYGFARN